MEPLIFTAVACTAFVYIAKTYLDDKEIKNSNITTLVASHQQEFSRSKKALILREINERWKDDYSKFISQKRKAKFREKIRQKEARETELSSTPKLLNPILDNKMQNNNTSRRRLNLENTPNSTCLH